MILMSTVYHDNENNRTWIDWFMLGVVVAIAGTVIRLSFTNTAKLAATLGLDDVATAFLVEVLFASLLFIRSRQRATSRNVPLFLHLGYFISFGFVTGVNIWGLSQVNSEVGWAVGFAVSGAMWLMETTLVWLWVDSNKPHVKSVKEQMKEAAQAIKEEKARQRIKWMLYEAKKPDLKLIEEARKAEQHRAQICKDGVPEFFQQMQTDSLDTKTPTDIQKTDSLLDKLKGLGIVGKVLARHETDTQIRQDRHPDTTDQIDKTDNEKNAKDSTTTGIDSGQTVPDRQRDNTKKTPVQTVDTTTDDTDKTFQTVKTQTPDRQTTDTNDKKTVQTDTQTVTKTQQSRQTKRQKTDSETRQKNKLSVIEGRKTDSKNTEKDKLARQTALKYYQENGKFPSYRKLGEMVGISKDKAGEVIRGLKAKSS